MAIFHSVPFCTTSQSIFRDLTSKNLVPSLSTSTLSLLSLNNYISAFLQHTINTAKHLNLSLLIQFLMLSRSKCSLRSEEDFLSSKVTLHIHLIILISLCYNLNKSPSFTARISLKKFKFNIKTSHFAKLLTDVGFISLHLNNIFKHTHKAKMEVVIYLVLAVAAAPY